MAYTEAVEVQIAQAHRLRSVFSDLSDAQLAAISRDVKIGRRVFYVYGLVDPRNGRLFYIGKGRGSRAWAHLKPNSRTVPSNQRKIARIKEILATGMEPEVELLLQVPNELAALAIEELLIDVLPGLTNIARTTKRARMQADMKAMKKGLRKLADGQKRLRKMLNEQDCSGLSERAKQTIHEMAYEPLPKMPTQKLD